MVAIFCEKHSISSSSNQKALFSLYQSSIWLLPYTPSVHHKKHLLVLFEKFFFQVYVFPSLVFYWDVWFLCHFRSHGDVATVQVCLSESRLLYLTVHHTFYKMNLLLLLFFGFAHVPADGGCWLSVFPSALRQSATPQYSHPRAVFFGLRRYRAIF